MILLLDYFLNYMILFISVLVSVSFFTLFERKLMSYFQIRKGPNKVGIVGVFQAISDGMKLFSNEFMYLYQSNLYYYLSPFLMFLISFMLWILYPYFLNLLIVNNFMLFLVFLMSLNIYPIMFAGMYSNSLYSMLGGLRSISQIISYEVSFILLMFSYLILFESLNLIYINFMELMSIFILFPLSMIFYISMLAELNRTPFDLTEGESELISGYNIEYMSGSFALIFLAEYSSIIFLSFIFSMLNFNFNILILMFMWFFMMYIIIMIRTLLPRIRYDNLMLLVWLNYLPISLNYLIIIMMIKYMNF